MVHFRNGYFWRASKEQLSFAIVDYGVDWNAFINRLIVSTSECHFVPNYELSNYVPNRITTQFEWENFNEN